MAPPRCGACGERCRDQEQLCATCKRELLAGDPLVESGPDGIERSFALGPYTGVRRRIVVAIKFARRVSLAPPAAVALADAVPEEELRGQIVPVPAAPLRARWRGFDPAEELAIALADATGLALAPCLRRAHGPRQARRSRSERIASPPRVRLAAPAPVRALLLDDVHTTGATLASCAAALREGGCREVVALTLARAQMPGRGLVAGSHSA